MAASAMIPAGWYLDPTRRHEYRYWGGTDWTASVCDGTVTATDALGSISLPPPEFPPAPPPPHLTEPSPVTAPAAPAGPRPRRRRWAVLAIASAAVAGLVIGLVIWAPWATPALLRPAGLTAGPSTTTSVVFHWSRPATGPAPDSYVILREGKMIGSVHGTVTFYRQAGLAPATAYRYRVAAVRDGIHNEVPPQGHQSAGRPPGLDCQRLDRSPGDV
jgi:fibronectin type III domain protein